MNFRTHRTCEIMHTHVKRRDLPSTAWTHAIAFATTGSADGTPDRAHATRWAAATWVGLLCTHAYLGHRNIYATPSGLGCVVMYKKPALGLAARAALGASPGLLAAAAVHFNPNPATFITCVTVVSLYVAVLASLLAGMSFNRNRDKAPEGTPRLPVPHRHVVLGLAAARPDAPKGETFALAADLGDSQPRGTVVVIHPRTPKLRQRYERAGYSPSKGTKMIKTIEGRRP